MKSNYVNRKHQKTTKSFWTIILSVSVALFLLIGTINCGGSSSGPTVAPKAFLHDFIAKHETMVDDSLVEFYIQEEQAQVAELINTSINSLKAQGTLESMQQATFDFTALQLNVVGEKEKYIDDEPKTFMKVAVKGSYTMNQKDTSKTISADQIIILEMVGRNWKVTETINPWS